MLPQGWFSTLAGTVLSTFGRFPVVGERVRWDRSSFEATVIDNWQIGAVVVRRIDVAPSSSARPT